MDTRLYLIYHGTTSFSIYFGASTYSTRTTYALGKDFLNLPLGDCRLSSSLVYLDVCHSCATVASVASAQLLQSCVIRLCQSRERNKSSCSG